MLATDGARRLVCSRSTPGIPYEIVVGDVSEPGNVAWQVIDEPVLDEDGECFHMQRILV